MSELEKNKSSLALPKYVCSERVEEVYLNFVKLPLGNWYIYIRCSCGNAYLYEV